MKKLLLSLSMLSTASFISCREESQKLDCSLVLCPPPFISVKIKFVDKSTGENLLAGPGAVYSASDVKIIPPYEGLGRTVAFDSTTGVVTLHQIIRDDQLQLGDLPAEEIAIQLRPLTEACCGPYATTKISVGGTTLCEPCTDLDESVFVIKK